MKVLAIGCHPDDLEIACAGTLNKYAKRGDEVYMVHVANGSKGHKVIMPDELKAMRHIEAENAAKIVGAKKVYDMDIDDLAVDYQGYELMKELAGIIKDIVPDLILTHAPNDYMADHNAVNRLVFDASFSASIDHLDGKPGVDVVPLYYFDTLAGVDFLPDEYVDISDEIDTKLEALSCHESQIKWMLEHDHIDFLDFVKTCSKFRGLQCGVPYAEAFKKCNRWPRPHAKRLLP